MKIVTYSRNEYLNSIMQIKDFDTLKFSKEALEWWDNYYSWIKEPPLCLKENENDICYLFYNISKDYQYLTIHNIFTPKEYRKKGYAYKMLNHLFKIHSKSDIQRFKMYCVASSIKFYMELGLKFWGVNDIGQYYCDFKLPKNIDDIDSITKNELIENIREEDFIKIFEKLKANGSNFKEKELKIHKQCIKDMGNSYLFEKISTRNKQLK